MGFAVFSNLGDFNTMTQVNAIADLFIKDTVTQKKELQKQQPDSVAAILKDASAFQKFKGNYIGDDGTQLNIDLRNDRIFYQISGDNNFLLRNSKDTFSMPGRPQLRFVFSARAKDTIVDLLTPDRDFHLKKYNRGQRGPGHYFLCTCNSG